MPVVVTPVSIFRTQLSVLPFMVRVVRRAPPQLHLIDILCVYVNADIMYTPLCRVVDREGPHLNCSAADEILSGHTSHNTKN